MKNIFTLLAGIVFILVIPITGCHHHGSKNRGVLPISKMRDVTITLTSVSKEDGGKHLMLNDSIHSGIDSIFITDVYRGRKIRWEKGNNSGIEQIKEIRGLSHHFIFIEDPHQIGSSGKFEMQIPSDVQKCTMEEYVIVFELENDTTTYVSDPYLRIPPDE